jgi:secreted trypsin-like serine protease
MRFPTRRGTLVLGCVIAVLASAPGAFAREPMIVGGTPAAPGVAPWATHIEVRTPTSLSICAASLIGELWLLTAAHCVTDDNGVVLANAAIRATTGVVDRRTAPPAALRLVDRIAVGAYNAGAATADWALLRLTEPVTTGAVRLAQPRDMAGVAPGASVRVAGWGLTTEDGALSPVLNQAVMPLLDDAACASLLGPLFAADAMLCAGVLAGGVDTCAGDSGAALVTDDRRGLPVEIGITSWGFGCARPGLPGVYARVSRYAQEIVAALRADPRAPVRDPSVVSSEAETLTRRSTTITAVVDSGGLAGVVDVEFGRSTAYGSRVSVSSGGGGAAEAPVVLTGLEPAGMYHYRVVVETAAGIAAGPNQTFRAGEDSESPVVRAFAASGPAGGTVRLRYEVADAIGERTRERITILTRAGARVATLHTPLARDDVTRSRPWRPSGLSRGRYRFCVVGFDEAGNASASSCAPLRLT